MGRAGEGRVFQNVEQPRRRAARGGLLALAGFIGLCLLVGITAAGFTAASVSTWYRALAHPPGTPPNWLFGPVWTVLYVLMGVSAWLVWRRQDLAPRRVFGALRLWGWQLLANAMWTPAFFWLRSPALGMAVLVVLFTLVVLTALVFRRLSVIAAALLLPYVAWVGYAAYLNVGILALN